MISVVNKKDKKRIEYSAESLKPASRHAFGGGVASNILRDKGLGSIGSSAAQRLSGSVSNCHSEPNNNLGVKNLYNFISGSEVQQLGSSVPSTYRRGVEFRLENLRFESQKFGVRCQSERYTAEPYVIARANSPWQSSRLLTDIQKVIVGFHPTYLYNSNSLSLRRGRGEVLPREGRRLVWYQ